MPLFFTISCDRFAVDEMVISMTSVTVDRNAVLVACLNVSRVLGVVLYPMLM